MIDCVVAPVDQRFPVADEEVSVIVEPAQKADGPLIVGTAGAGFAVTTLARDVGAEARRAGTETRSRRSAEHEIDCVVAPVDQRFPVADEEVRVIVDPAQKDDGPLIVGTAGAGFAVTTLARDVAVQPFASVTVTV